MNFTAINLYFLGSVVMAILILVEASTLIKSSGKFLGNKKLSAISFLEFVWLVISVIASYQLKFKGIQIIIPVLYILHNAAGWVYGMKLFKDAGLIEKLEKDEKDIAIPRKFIDFNISFGIIFLLVSLFMLAQSFGFIALNLNPMVNT